MCTTEPDHDRAQNNLRYYNQILEQQASERGKGDDGDAPAAAAQEEFKNKRIMDEYRQSQEFAAYEALCRGEDVIVRSFKLDMSLRNDSFILE